MIYPSSENINTPYAEYCYRTLTTMFLPQQALFIGVLIASVVISPKVSPSPVAQTQAPTIPGKEIIVTTSSGESEIGLAKRLKRINAKMYSAYWCPHCQSQLAMFGKEASQLLEVIECAPDGKDSKTALCKQAKIEGFPTWVINNQRYVGTQSLNAIADVSRYLGPRKFINPDRK